MKLVSRIAGLLVFGAFAACEGNITTDVKEIAPVIGEGDADAIPGEYIVVLSQRSSPGLVSDLVTRVGLVPGNKINFAYSSINAFSARMDAVTLDEIRRNPDVSYVEVDRVVTLNTVHDTTASNLHGLDRIDQRNLPNNGSFNDFDRAGVGVHFYGVDTGIRSTHVIFQGRMGNGFTAINDGRGTEDCNDHGTHTAGTAVGDLVGVARGATVHPVRVLGCSGSGSNAGIIAGLDFVRNDCAAKGGPCVANLSIGGGFSAALNNAVASAVNAGVVVVVAAGNENQNACNTSPASEPKAITVAASDSRNDTRASFSNFGSCVDLFAPGVSIFSGTSTSNNAGANLDGTSMAAPHVAGVAAAFLGANPNATPSQVAAAILNNATPNKISNANGTPNLLLFNNFGNTTPPPPPPQPAADSCEDRCGEFDQSASCQCDDKCAQFGDCCADLEELCSAAPPGFVVLHSTNFEANLGGYNDGGVDATYVSSSSVCSSGSRCVELRDNSLIDSSISLASGLNISSFNQVKIEFSFVANSFEQGEDFFLETNSGSGFSIKAVFAAGTSFVNNTRYTGSILLDRSSTTFSDNFKLRIRSDASDDNDQVYIDDVVISAQ